MRYTLHFSDDIKYYFHNILYRLLYFIVADAGENITSMMKFGTICTVLFILELVILFYFFAKWTFYYSMIYTPFTYQKRHWGALYKQSELSENHHMTK